MFNYNELKLRNPTDRRAESSTYDANLNLTKLWRQEEGREAGERSGSRQVTGWIIAPVSSRSAACVLSTAVGQRLQYPVSWWAWVLVLQNSLMGQMYIC